MATYSAKDPQWVNPVGGWCGVSHSFDGGALSEIGVEHGFQVGLRGNGFNRFANQHTTNGPVDSIPDPPTQTIQLAHMD